MRRLLLALPLLAAPTISTAQQTPPPGGPEHHRGGLFISPMGEPFHGPDAQPNWFAGADTNHDGAISQAEFEADAARFFALLDRRHDGEIDPDDIDYYETVLAPEIRTGGFGGGGGFRGGGRGGHGGDHGGGGGHRGGGGGFGGGGEGGGESESGGSQPQPREVPQGAARFGYFDYPEPVTVADRNFNRGIDADEFTRAADQRFALLDKDGDGKLTQAELPHLGSFFRPGRAKPGGRQPIDTPAGE
jgi:hypothetical protein